MSNSAVVPISGRGRGRAGLLRHDCRRGAGGYNGIVSAGHLTCGEVWFHPERRKFFSGAVLGIDDNLSIGILHGLPSRGLRLAVLFDNLVVVLKWHLKCDHVDGS